LYVLELKNAQLAIVSSFVVTANVCSRKPTRQLMYSFEWAIFFL
jgi:hypothetical protein